MTAAPTPEDVERLARGLEEGFAGYAAWLQPAAAALRRLQAENERLRMELVAEASAAAEQKLRADQLAQQHRMQAQMHAQATQQLAELDASKNARIHELEMQALDLASVNSILKRQDSELEARKPLPMSYLCGTLISGIDGATTVSLHFSDLVEANAWFEGITDQFDAALVDKSPDLQEPLVDKTAKLQDRPAALIASREVVSDGPLRVTRLNPTEEGRAALTSKATGPLPGITGGSS
ncbi:hypothetical protein [Delftia deserti]|uniref:Uncharacterized protein n=1 Tax=Delftia deserti TaxID=1651218 RepID=A0ABW5EYF4_9BURK